MIRWLVVLGLFQGGCVSSNAVECENGTTCPQAQQCDVVHGGCVAPDQLSSCEGMPENTLCLADGACHGGVCFSIACGNGFVDPMEVCDDGNNADGDMCARDCSSDLTCGNGTIDMSTGETCDDRNHVNHDGCTSTCRLEEAHWLNYVPKMGAKRAMAATYDSRRDRVVVFSGSTSLNDAFTTKTWEWNGTLWAERASPVTPPPRYESAMAFDHARGRAVLFGGNSNSLQGIEMNDTWEWDGNTWYPVAVAGPPPRSYPALVYDAARKRIVMFGGNNAIGGVRRNDTWEYDGTAWKQILTPVSPPPRFAMLASYDPKRGRVVISSGLGVGSAAFTDTWEYDGTTWRDVTPTAGLKPQLVHGGMAFDPTLQKLVVFGGTTPPSTMSNKTYTWDGTTWTDLNISLAQPEARNRMAFVSAYPRPLLAGGFNSSTSAIYDDTYYFTGSTWTLPSSLPNGGYDAVTDPVRRVHILYGNGNTYELNRNGYALLQSGTPSPRGSPIMVADPAHGNVVMFGGGIGGAGTGSTETWTLANGSWTLRPTATTPPGRQIASAVFDGSRVIMFGGRASDSGIFFNDTWSWDGTNWSLIPTTVAPPARFLAAMGYDPIRKESILFGGFTYDGDTTFWNDTWAFDGTTWTERKPLVAPSARAGARLTWDAARGNLVLVGGGVALDSWEWTGSEWRAIGVPDLPPNDVGGVAPMLDGSGIVAFSSLGRLELRWDGPTADERCDGGDLDADAQTACADSDCWSICAPLCPPGTSCMAGGATCGDGVCSATRETCHTCAADCPCTPVCGDFYCDPGETCPGDCPM